MIRVVIAAVGTTVIMDVMDHRHLMETDVGRGDFTRMRRCTADELKSKSELGCYGVKLDRYGIDWVYT